MTTESTTTLSQWVGIRKGTSAKATSETTVLYAESKKAAPYTGLKKTFRPKDEDGETYPEESKKVTQVAEDLLKQLQGIESDWWDVVATCDHGNTQALADLVVDGATLVKGASVPFLLFLEKRLVDLRTFVENMPTLDENEDWTKDPNGDLFRTGVQTTFKTKKVQRPIVLYQATPEHPAQTQLITEDVLVGHWDTIKMSGALTVPRRRELIAKITKVLRATKFAMAQANGTVVEKQSVGETVFGFLFA